MCANCGKAGSNGVKLRNCTACLLVKYYGVDYQRVAHRKQHKKACRERAAELKDERLYGWVARGRTGTSARSALCRYRCRWTSTLSSKFAA